MAYALTEALQAMRRSKLTALATIGSLTAFMFLLGLFLAAHANLSAVSAKIRQRVQIEAFLEDSVTRQEALSLADRIRELEPVQTVSYVSKDSALAVFRQQFGDEALQALESNPLPASLKIELHQQNRTFSQVEQLAGQVAQLSGVADVEYGRRWLSRLDNLLSAVAIVTIILGLIVATCSVLLVATTIKLAFHARREAVEIMRLVGADGWVVTAPFFVEGALYGLSGSLLGIILLGCLFLAISPRLAGLRFIPNSFLLGLVIFGTLLGAAGSLLSLRRAR
jgi:cell division transport system permease protein